MRSRRNANPRRLIILIGIFIFAFIIIFGSALLTKGTKKKEKNMQISEPNDVKSSISRQSENTQVQEIAKANNTVTSEKKTQEVQNLSETKKSQNTTNTVANSSNAKKTTKAASGRLPVANPEAIALCKQAQTSSEKNIYLTFDDGPSPNITPQVLETLKKYDVPATFFVLGSRVELYPELVRQEYEEGHYIANHGYTHTYSSIYSSVQAVIDEYNQTEKAVQEALGLPEYHTLLFRFPGGSSGGPYDKLKSQAKSKLEEMGIASTNWNCLNGDAEGGARSKQQLINRLYETAKGWDSLVVLMHDANDKQTTADALPEIIEHYKAEGYTFKNYYEIFQ